MDCFSVHQKLAFHSSGMLPAANNAIPPVMGFASSQVSHSRIGRRDLVSSFCTFMYTVRSVLSNQRLSRAFRNTENGQAMDSVKHERDCLAERYYSRYNDTWHEKRGYAATKSQHEMSL